MKDTTATKNYKSTFVIAIVYAVLLVGFAIYKEFFYVDGTWFHGFAANGFAIFSSLLFIVLLFTFKQVVNKLLQYSQINGFINALLIFLGIATLAQVIVMYQSVRVYSSLEDGQTFNSLTAFAGSSVIGAILVFISSFAIIVISILLGFKIRKFHAIHKLLFQVLGYTFIVHGVVSVFSAFGLLGTDIFQFLIKATLVFLMGLICHKVLQMNASDLEAVLLAEKNKELGKMYPKNQYQKAVEVVEKKYSYQAEEIEEKAKAVSPIKEELPVTHWDEFKDKEAVISYYKNLPEDEVKRIEHLVQSKHNQSLSDAQKYDFVLHYIAEKKLYDHQRFLPK